jgi:SRSO17 transposase
VPERLPATAAPLPLEAYAAGFGDLFTQRSQREGFRRYLEGVLLPAERNKTATALANTGPTAGAQHPRAQVVQWFLSGSTWDAAAVNARRTALRRADPATAPDERGVLVIDEHGDREWGRKTAHVGRQYLANLGKTDRGVVSVTSLWADERVYWPLGYEPYTPQHHFAKGRADPACRTKLAIAGELVTAAVEEDPPFRAVVADSFHGEDAGCRQTLHGLQVGYVLALKPSRTWWHQIGAVGALWQAAELAGWRKADAPGAWVAVERRFRDGHTERWWALEVEAGPYGPARGLRAVVATTAPATLPDHGAWYLATDLPAGDADLAEVVRLYGLRMWVEQAYKQTKHALGWGQYQARGDAASRRHWQLVCCAFSFCWRQHSEDAAGAAPALSADAAQPVADEAAGRGENAPPAPAGVLAGGVARRPRLAGTLDRAPALLAGVVAAAPAARLARPT